jgi:hypothetical protein
MMNYNCSGVDLFLFRLTQIFFTQTALKMLRLDVSWYRYYNNGCIIPLVIYGRYVEN